jgi:hypothetical protein
VVHVYPEQGEVPSPLGVDGVPDGRDLGVDDDAGCLAADLHLVPVAAQIGVGQADAEPALGDLHLGGGIDLVLGMKVARRLVGDRNDGCVLGPAARDRDRQEVKCVVQGVAAGLEMTDYEPGVAVVLLWQQVGGHVHLGPRAPLRELKILR